jgi:hypothetical protein
VPHRNNDLMTTREAAEHCRNTPETILAWRKPPRSLVPAGHNGKTFLWKREDIEKQIVRRVDDQRVTAILKRKVSA